MTDTNAYLWRLEGGQYCVHILCTKIFAAALQQTLTGWAISPAQKDCKPEISVAFESDSYVVNSLVLGEAQRRSDFVDTLNEFFLSLVYYLCHLTPGAVLLHCAAFFENDESHIVIGQKKRGKSSLTYKKAAQGVRILADDLLLWHAKRAEFTCLGLPIRMRRPIIPVDGKLPDPAHFIAGAAIAYSKIGAYDIAPIGDTFLVDRVWELGEDFEAQSVAMLKIPKRFKSYKIGDEYSEIKKTEIEVSRH